MNPDPKSRKNAEKKKEKTPDAKVAIAKGHNSGTYGHRIAKAKTGYATSHYYATCHQLKQMKHGKTSRKTKH